jgi:G3E family GTPase
VLTGFLGAGKTTLLNQLLQQREFANTAVLINEFGEVGLDHILVEALDEEVVLLNAGCLCCTVRGDIVGALRKLLDRNHNAEERLFERIIIETTGLADPAPILHTIMSDPHINLHVRLDGVVTVVDAANAQATLDQQSEAVKKIAVADRLVVTKLDLCMPAHLAALCRRLRKLSPTALILPARDGVIDPKLVLNLGPFKPETKISEVLTWLNAEALPQPNAHHEHHNHQGHDPNRHDARISTFCLTFDQPLVWSGVGLFLEMLLAIHGEKVLRVKGLLNLIGQERPVVVHGVQHTFHLPVILGAWPREMSAALVSSSSRATLIARSSRPAPGPSRRRQNPHLQPDRVFISRPDRCRGQVGNDGREAAGLSVESGEAHAVHHQEPCCP